MKTRTEIRAAIKANLKEMERLNEENTRLQHEDYLLTDDVQQFVEGIEEWPNRDRRKKAKISKLVGRIHYIERFEDVGTGQWIDIERKRIVRIDGQWVY